MNPHSQEIQLLLGRVLAYQIPNGLVPYAWGPSRRTGGDYAWGQWMMALMYAERTGYLEHDAAGARIGRLLEAIERLPKFHGWLYKGYDLKTFEPAFQGFGFQPFYMMSLILAGRIFPKLRPLTEKLLKGYDYSFNYDPKERCLADFNIARHVREHFIPLDGPSGKPAAERRLAYVVHSYLTGDISPWLLKTEPAWQEVGDRRFMAVSSGFNFDICHMHQLLPEIGYYERSWEDFLEGTASHIEDEGLAYFPIRSTRLEENAAGPALNIEHHQAMAYLSWYWDPSLHIIPKTFDPELGLLRWNDRWRFYWGHGKHLTPVRVEREALQLDFPQCADPACARRTELRRVRIFAAAPEGPARLNVTFNGTFCGSIELPREAAWVDLPLEAPVERHNRLQIEAQENRPFQLHHYEDSVRASRVGGREIAGIAAEATCEGPYIHTPGSENSENALVEDTCTGLSARIQTAHEYSLAQELERDARFVETQVAWVGDYHARASIAGRVYNVSDRPVRVEYARKPYWKDASSIRVEGASSVEVTPTTVCWTAEPRKLYSIHFC